MFHAAPSGSPCELRVSHTLPTTAEFSWTPVPKDKQNGVITGYIIQVIGDDCTSGQQEISVDKDATSAEISNLNPFTKYTFSVSAKTKAGSGPAATIASRTPEACKTWLCFLLVYHDHLAMICKL